MRLMRLVSECAFRMAIAPAHFFQAINRAHQHSEAVHPTTDVLIEDILTGMGSVTAMLKSLGDSSPIDWDISKMLGISSALEGLRDSYSDPLIARFSEPALESVKLFRVGANPCLSSGEWCIDNPHTENESGALWSGTDESPLPCEVQQLLESVIEQLGQIPTIEKEGADACLGEDIDMSRQMLFPELDLEPLPFQLSQTVSTNFSHIEPTPGPPTTPVGMSPEVLPSPDLGWLTDTRWELNTHANSLDSHQPMYLEPLRDLFEAVPIRDGLVEAQTICTIAEDKLLKGRDSGSTVTSTQQGNLTGESELDAESLTDKTIVLLSTDTDECYSPNTAMIVTGQNEVESPGPPSEAMMSSPT